MLTWLPNTDMDMESLTTRQQMLDNVMCNQGGAVLEKRGRDLFLAVSFMLDYSIVRVSSPSRIHVSSTTVADR